jgi:hypothetical protein
MYHTEELPQCNVLYECKCMTKATEWKNIPRNGPEFCIIANNCQDILSTYSIMTWNWRFLKATMKYLKA